MKTESNIRPASQFEIEALPPIEGRPCTVILYDNIQGPFTRQVSGEDQEPQNYFTFDRFTVDTIYREGLAAAVEADTETWIQKAREAEKADEELNHECFERRKNIKRTPIPFSDEEKALRMLAYNKNYLLPDGDELFTDRRRCIYWDEKTERSKKVEAEADRLKFNVIEYRKMFPYMGNSMDSCKATKEIYYPGGR